MIIAGELAEGSAIRLACHSDVFSWEKPEN
jgi:hypothetical protein